MKEACATCGVTSTKRSATRIGSSETFGAFSTASSTTCRKATADGTRSMTVDGWSDFFVAAGGAAAALTGLLFIAVSLRPREIRHSPLMIGRARAAFYAFATITLVALLAL